MGCIHTSKKLKVYHKSERIEGLRSQLIRHQSTSSIWIHFDKLKEIGFGINGSVYEVRRIDSDSNHVGETYALKSVKKKLVKPKLLKDLQNEIVHLKELDHPNIVKLYET